MPQCHNIVFLMKIEINRKTNHLMLHAVYLNYETVMRVIIINKTIIQQQSCIWLRTTPAKKQLISNIFYSSSKQKHFKYMTDYGQPDPNLETQTS